MAVLVLAMLLSASVTSDFPGPRLSMVVALPGEGEVVQTPSDRPARWDRFTEGSP